MKITKARVRRVVKKTLAEYALADNDLSSALSDAVFDMLKAVEQMRALDGAKCAECLGINGTHSDTCTNNSAYAPRK